MTDTFHIRFYYGMAHYYPIREWKKENAAIRGVSRLVLGRGGRWWLMESDGEWVESGWRVGGGDVRRTGFSAGRVATLTMTLELKI